MRQEVEKHLLSFFVLPFGSTWVLYRSVLAQVLHEGTAVMPQDY